MSLHAEACLVGPLVRVLDVTCCAPRSAAAGEEHNEAADIALVRRGVFSVHLRGEALTADPGCAVVFARDASFRVSHPADGGDRCTVLRFAPEVHEEALGDRTGTVRVGPLPAPAGEEEAMHALARVAAAPRLAATRVAERRAAAVRELLAAQAGAPWRLGDIAREVHCSPYHLARQFRAATGTTITAHLLGVRLALALDRLAEGEDDLARLAADLGFSSHSHFTARFRQRLGCAPSQMRKRLTARARREI